MVYRRIEHIRTHQCNCAALDIMAAVPGRGRLRSTGEGCMVARVMVRMLSSTTSALGVTSGCGVVAVWVCTAGTAGQHQACARELRGGQWQYGEGGGGGTERVGRREWDVESGRTARAGGTSVWVGSMLEWGVHMYHGRGGPKPIGGVGVA